MLRVSSPLPEVLKSVNLRAAGFDFPDCAFENREVASATFPVMFELRLNKWLQFVAFKKDTGKSSANGIHRSV